MASDVWPGDIFSSPCSILDRGNTASSTSAYKFDAGSPFLFSPGWW